MDDNTGLCVGYTVSQAPGLWRVYDTDGVFVTMEEAPLEAPLVDPTDLALIAFGVFRILRTGRALLEAGAKASLIVKLSQSTLTFLRARLKIGLSARNLRMTETAAAHMLNPGRYVPLQIMEKAIRNSKRMPDPRGAVGMARYETEMYKMWFNKHLRQYEYKKYTLEIIVRESDWTITHFMYVAKGA